MVLEQEGKFLSIPPASVASTATAVLGFDGKGFDHASITLDIGTIATTSAAFTVLKVVESDDETATTSMDSIADLTGATETSTSAGILIPTQAEMENGGGVIDIELDLRNRKRYNKLVVTPGQTAVIGAKIKLTRSEQSADTVAEKSGVSIDNTNAVGLASLKIA